MVGVGELVVVALSAGAGALGKGIATGAASDGYAALKALLVSRYEKLAAFVGAVEDDPDSQPEQEVLSKKIEQSDAASDAELLEAAKGLLSALQQMRDVPGAAAVLDFGRLDVAGSVDLADIQASGSALKAETASIGGNLKLSGFRQKNDG